MTKAPCCLHLPVFYEDDTAFISWQSVDEAVSYQLECVFDESFEQAEAGRSWTALDAKEQTWGQIEAGGLSWTELEQMSAQGVTWQNIEFADQSWEQAEKQGLTWAGIAMLPVRFTVFDGMGEPCRAPDQGLTWSTLESVGNSWSGIEAEAQTWQQFDLVPSGGLTWAQMDSDAASWESIEQKQNTWLQWERQPTRGLMWNSMDAHFMSWEEFERRSLSWDGLERLPSDDKTHRAYVVNIPLYKKMLTIRVRVFNGSMYTQYLVSSPQVVHPRSLAKYKPPCLHLPPKLYEDAAAQIVWGELYGASGYVVERKLGGGQYQVVYDGPGVDAPAPPDCNEWKQLWYTPDCKRHFSFDDHIPLYEHTTVQYRIRGYNSTDSSQYLVSSPQVVHPRSLAKYKPPCLHLPPKLYEDAAAQIVWGELYGASEYVVERKLGGGQYQVVYDGPGVDAPTPPDCNEWKRLWNTPDCKRHFSFDDHIPLYEHTTVQYRIRGYNSTDSSQYLELPAAGIVPVIYREDSIQMRIIAGEQYTVQLQAEAVESFGGVVMTLEYDSTQLRVEGFGVETPTTTTDTHSGTTPTNAEIVSQIPGKIRLRCIKPMESGRGWGGLLITARVTALNTGSTRIVLS